MRIAECRGQWAVVTGASSGIGAEFCRQLAAAGVHLVMVARRRALLDTLAAALTAQHGIRTLVLDIDLSARHSAETVKARTDAAKISPRLLINNAASGPWGSFERSDARALEALVHLTTATPIALCSHYAAALRSAGNAAVINVSSPAALQPVPYIAAYSAAKACLHQFSLALHGEWEASGVTVQTLLPGADRHRIRRQGRRVCSDLGIRRLPAASIVKASLDALATGRAMVTNSRQVTMQRAFAGLAPVEVVIRRVGRMFAPPQGR